jgi:hypothetical protein
VVAAVVVAYDDDDVVDEFRPIAIAVGIDIRPWHGGKVETRLAMEGEHS